MYSLNDLKLFLDFNLCRQVQGNSTGSCYYVGREVARLIGVSCRWKAKGKVNPKHVHSCLLASEYGGDQRTLIVTLEGVGDFLAKVQTTHGDKLRRHWQNGTLSTLRVITEYPWYLKRLDAAEGVVSPTLEEWVAKFTDTACGVVGVIDSATTTEHSEVQATALPPTALVPWFEEKIGDDLVQTCDARELWVKLGVKRDFSNWIRGRIEEYNFAEDVDFVKVFSVRQSGRMEQKYTGGKSKIDYRITFDMAKELAMVERNEMGRKIRKYFIQCEKEWREMKSQPVSNANSAPIDTSIVSRLLDAADQDRQMILQLQAALLEDHKLIHDLVTRSQAQSQIDQATTITPPKLLTVAGYANLLSISLDEPDAAKIGKRATQLCTLRKLSFNHLPHAKHGSVGAYPVEILDEIFTSIYHGHSTPPKNNKGLQS